MTNAETMLQTGAEILAKVLSPVGFQYVSIWSGPTSGAPAASGKFVRGNRELEIHFRYALGIVIYRLGKQMMFHEDYMQSYLNKAYASHYPGFSDDSLDGFRHLAQDLEEYGVEFVTGSDEELSNRIAAAKLVPHEKYLP